MSISISDTGYLYLLSNISLLMPLKSHLGEASSVACLRRVDGLYVCESVTFQQQQQKTEDLLSLNTDVKNSHEWQIGI